MILALDLSLTATGWARTLSSGPGTEAGVIRSKQRGVARLQEILNQVHELAKPADLVCIEGYAFDRPNQAHQIGELGGIVRLALYQLRKPVAIVPPSCLKKVASGKGNAPKELVLAEAIKRLRYDGFDHNVADARWLLAMAQIRYGLPGAPELPQGHLEGMAKVPWPENGQGALA